MRTLASFVLLATLLAALIGCAGGATGAPAPTAAAAGMATGRPTPAAAATVSAATRTVTRVIATPVSSPSPVASPSADASPEATDVTATIRLAGDRITVAGRGVQVEGQIVTIASAGTYSISGRLTDGQIVVDTEDAEKVVLLLNGADIACATGAPIYIANAEKVVLTLADGTQNSVTDGAQYTFPDAQTDEPNAAIFSKDDLTINGAGALTVKANYNNGIASKDDLKITGGQITVQAVNDGIKGRDSLVIKAGVILVNAGADGLQANNAEDAGQGYITIEGGTVNVTAGKDAVQAETNLTIGGGQLALVSGGGSKARKGEESAKGLKAGGDMTIAGGVIAVDASDDALNANGRITIGGGELILATSDDGVHADVAFTMDGGDLRIAKSYEGIESNEITINDGVIRLVASDDGINGVSATAPAGGMPMRGGPAGMEGGDSRLYIHGGHIAVDALGDGIDINGAVEMTGGTVLVNGPTANNNAALDHGSFKITGGFLVAAGSAGMAQAPDATSTQYSLMHFFPSVQAAGTLVHIQAADGTPVVTFAPTKTFQSIVVSAPTLKNGGNYVVYTGGRSTGAVADSLYSGGKYTPGTQVAAYTLTSVTTGAGPGMGGFPGGRGGPRPVRP